MTDTSYPAGTYFVDAVNGNDANSGMSTSAAWKTIAKVNAMAFAPGNSVLFKRGQTFYGSLTLNQSGTAGSPITFGAYGSGTDRPIITGFTTLSGWSLVSPGIYESPCGSCTSATKVVTVNGVDTAMGRWPNADATNGGYRTITSHVGSSSITDISLSSSPNWSGGEAVIRRNRWVLDRNPIINHVGGTLTYSTSSPYDAADGFGYFIQNHPSTLDQVGEWYFSSTTSKMQMFFGTNSPSSYSVRVSSVDNIFYILYHDYITIDGLAFEGASNSAIYLGSAKGITIQNCTFDNSYNGIWADNWGGSSAGALIQNSTFNHMNNMAIHLTNEFVGAKIQNNTLQNTGILPGMGNAYTALSSAGMNSLIDGNQILNTGYVGIDFSGSGVVVQNNLVNYFCSVKDDGGGIYTANPTPTTITGDVIQKNIVLNAVGAGQGTDYPSYSSTHGIYLDDNSNGVAVIGNTTANMGNSGIFLHNSFNVSVSSNTVVNSTMAAFRIVNDEATATIQKLTVTNNIFFASAATQLVADFVTLHSDIRSFGSFNNNVYARPLDDRLDFTIQPLGGGTAETTLDLAGWQTYSGQDGASVKSPFPVSTSSAVLFNYNSTDLSQTFPINGTYTGMDGKTYSGSYSIPPHTSLILLKN